MSNTFSLLSKYSPLKSSRIKGSQIRGNAEDLERVFHNLFLNAIQAFSGEGEVIAETEFSPSEKMVEISVIDNGPGIPKSDRERLFEPFFTTKEEGTGLGLSICRSIIQQHRGSIAIESNRIRGTKVTVKLPLDPLESL
jgi:two-component system NtrC family sensor kinase